MKKWIKLTFFAILLLIISSVIIQKVTDSGSPDFINVEGIPNFVQVSPTLYRSGQPTAEGMKEIEKMGIRTVINLRNFHSDSSKIMGTNLSLVEIPMKPWPLPDSDIGRFLKIVTDTSKTPVLVHCYAGSDRTGTMVAVYRIVVEDWSKDDAIEEMTRGGFGYKWFLINLTQWIRKLDVEKFREEL